MSWHFSRALVEEYSAATSSDGAPSVPSNGNPTPQLYLQPDRMTAFSRLSRFGMTCAPLMDDHSAALLTWFLAASRAKTSAPPALARGSTARAPGSGEKWHELSVKYDPRTSSWRTHRCLWEEALQWSSVTLPRWGMTRSGLVFQHPTQERPINATASGLWPTPTAMMTGDTTAVDVFLARQQRLKEKHKGRNGNGCGPDLAMAVKLQMWPTPTSSLATKGGRVTPRKGREGGTPIEAISARKWPTPTASASASASKGSSPASLTRKSGESRENDRLDHAVMAAEGGQLNPDWVEWLMNWPLGWTSLEPMKNENWKHWAESGAAYFQSNGLREMWFDRDPATPPQGQKSSKQLSGKCRNPLPQMPQSGPHAGRHMGSGDCRASDLQSMQSSIPAQADAPFINLRGCMPSGMGESQCREALEYIPRVATGVTARVDRLKAIGNGQVPRVAAAAFTLLSDG